MQKEFLMPAENEMTALLGERRYRIWKALCEAIESQYDMDRLWGPGGKAWKFEYKYRRGGKTLCALYAKENCMGFMIILGRQERERFEADRQDYSAEVQKIYDASKTYHDGKWMMFLDSDTSLFGDFLRLLEIKRRPNKN